MSHYLADKHSLIRAVIAHQANAVMADHHDPAFGDLDSIAALPRGRSGSSSSNPLTMQQRRDLGPDADPDALAYSLLAATQGGYLLTQAHRDAYALEATLDAAITHIESLAIEAGERSSGYLGLVGRARSQSLTP
jgi:TetR/AcrR family transcriptional regulator, transcriptional repressor for nem operon